MQNDIKTAKRCRVRYNAETLGKSLKRARTEKGLSQRAVCDRSGVPQAQLSRIERGLVHFSVETMVELARVLDLEPIPVPWKFIPAVTGIIRRRAEGPPRPAYTLDSDEDDQ